jgi:Ca2+-binding RTX toxin-like protein
VRRFWRVLVVLSLFVLGVVLAMILAGALFYTAASARPDCTRRGTNGPDKIRGSDHRDVICLLGGDDYGHGRGGADVLKGDDGSDTLVGGNGVDRIEAGTGNDDVFVTDEQADTVFGGPGSDSCFGDKMLDTFYGCERRVKV